MVPRERLVQANSLYNFTLTASQLLGIVFIAPTILKSVGAGRHVRHGDGDVRGRRASRRARVRRPTQRR